MIEIFYVYIQNDEQHNQLVKSNSKHLIISK